jgi:macrodomain Ter protein organizer (MatP/YcbG family)
VKTLISYNDDGTLVLYNADGLIAVIKKCPWQVAHLMSDGMKEARNITKYNPEKSLSEILSHINEVPTDIREWTDQHPDNERDSRNPDCLQPNP